MMKKILFLLLCLATLGIWSCAKDENLAADGPRMAISSNVISFDADGGFDQLAVITKGDGPTIDTEEWITASVADGVLNISVGGNPGSGSRGAYVKLTASKDKHEAKDSVYVLQFGAPSLNLSEETTANSYIARTGGDYRFRADVKGGGSLDGASGYLEQYGAEIEGACYADLLWESTFDADRNRSREIISSQPVYIGGYIYFTAGPQEGNAVIAVKDASGVVLWSWHIWVTDAEIAASEHDGIVWMDRNLGALNNTPGDISNRGLLYQWGRKDPFLPSKMPYMVTEFDNWAQANYHNTEIGNGSSEWIFSVSPRYSTGDASNIPFAVRQPTWFLGNDGSYDWYAAVAVSSYLWGMEADGWSKTIFDPCPAGYKVPPAKAWGEDQTDAWGPNENNSRRWKGGTDDYYPLPGHLVYNYGQSAYCGALACYWTSEIALSSDGNSPTQYTHRLYFGIDRCSMASVGRGYGGSIRCVKE